MKASVIIFFLLFGVCLAYGQSAPVCQVFTTADGLSDDFVYDILQSRDGFIWFATENGLNRYDGARFEVFLPETYNPFSIGGISVYHLFEDSRGWIWMELIDGSIDVLDPKSRCFFHVLRKEKAAGDLDFTGVGMEFMETPDGAVWYAGSDGILKFNLQKSMLEKAIQREDAYLEPLCKKVIPVPSPNDRPDSAVGIQCIFFTQHQKLLVGTQRGLWALDLHSEKLDLIGMSTASISWIGQDPAGRIWMNHRNYDPDQSPWMHLLMPATETTIWDEKAGILQARTIKGSLGDVIHDAEGFFWGFRGDTLQKCQTQRFLNNENAEIQWPFERLFPTREDQQGTFTSLLLDRSGVLWVGSYKYGVSKISLQNPVFKSYFPSVDINSMIETPEGKFRVQERGRTGQYESIRSFDPKEPYPYQIFPLSDERDVPVDLTERYGDMQFDQAGNRWFRTEFRYILRKDAQTGEVQKFECKGYELCFDAKGHLLTLDSTGLVVFDPKTAQSRYFDFKKPGINIDKIGSDHFPDDYRAIWKASDGVMWILSPNGLIKAVPADAGYRFEILCPPSERLLLAVIG